MLGEGDEVPELELQDDNAATVGLGALDGPAVLYFYPRDDTPGCTNEAKDFSCLAEAFARAGVQLFGISPDSVGSHVKFKAKHGVSVRLLADVEKEAANRFGVWVEKTMYGRTFMGVERATFLIDGKGRVARCWRKVQVPGHAEEVLAAAKALNGR